MATLKDIATRCDVSISTVSRVLKNDKVIKVNDQTRKQIFDVANGLGYKIKKQDIAGTKVAIINWYSHDQELVDPYYYYIRKSIETECKANTFEFTNFYYEDQEPNYHLFDAVIALGKFNANYAQNLNTKFNNVIFIGYNPDPNLYDSVGINYELMMTNIFEYAQSLNINSIGLMNGREDIGDENFIDSRVIAFNKVSTQYEINTSNYSIDGKFTMESGFDMFNALHKENRIPELIVCGNDMIALGANKAAYNLDYTTGDDVKLIGINDIPNAKFMVPSLTTITISQKQIGIEAINLLKRRLNEQSSSPISIMVPTKLTIRKST